MRSHVYISVTVYDRDHGGALSASEGKGEEESQSWCLWGYWSPRMESNFVFINRKFLFAQLKVGNKEVLFWNGSLPSSIWCFYSITPPPKGQEGQDFFFPAKSSPRPLFQAEWVHLQIFPTLTHVRASISLPSSTLPLALPSRSHQEERIPFGPSHQTVLALVGLYGPLRTKCTCTSTHGEYLQQHCINKTYISVNR